MVRALRGALLGLVVLAVGCGGEKPPEVKPGAGTKAAPTAAPAATAPAADSPADRPPAAAPAPTGKRPDDDDPSPRVELKTSLGTIVLELDRARAPITVENFLHHVAAGYYEGTIFHRVIPTFMAQGGGYTQARKRKAPLRDPIRNESEGGLTNARGTIAMARSGDPDSATSQFFLNVVDNAYRLDFPKASGHGYAVFGKVVEGMDVVDRIRDSTIVDQGGAFKDCPEQDIVIESARRL